MNCYACETAAVNACRRCARPYCGEHGNDSYCATCLEPASALPSFNLYRGALLTMLVGTAVAVFLLVRPPGETTSAPVVVGRLTATATAEGEQTTIPAETPAEATRTPQPTTPPPAPSPTAPPAPAYREYVIQDGDTLYDIAEATIAPGDDLDAYARAIANLNQLDFDAPILTVGSTLLLPPLPPAPQ